VVLHNPVVICQRFGG